MLNGYNYNTTNAQKVIPEKSKKRKTKLVYSTLSRVVTNILQYINKD
jgi:hypothetical protein